MLWGLGSPIGQAGQCPLTALAQAEYPTPSRKGRRSARTASISVSLSLWDMAAISFVVGAYCGVCERQKSSKSRNDTATSMEVVLSSFSPAFSNRSASTARPRRVRAWNWRRVDADAPHRASQRTARRQLRRKIPDARGDKTARARNAAHLRHRARLIRHEIHDQRRCDHVEGFVRQRQLLRVGEAELCFRFV